MPLHIFCLLALFLTSFQSLADQIAPLNGIKVMVYTKNGKGFVHDNIPYAVKCIQKLGAEHKFQVDVSDDPAIFTTDKLNKYTLLIFANTNNEVFDNDTQRLAFRKYIQAGGGFVGIHSVTGTERNWTWFKQLLGGSFAWHPKVQPFNAQVIDPGHPSMQGIPKTWPRSLGDECYFLKDLYPGIRVVMVNDLNSLKPNEKDSLKIAQYAAPYKDWYPSVWHQHFDGGNIWITTLGHNKEYYDEPMFVKHILLGIKFIAAQSKKLDLSKAYATDRDTPVRY